jgi:hypothetical protein
MCYDCNQGFLLLTTSGICVANCAIASASACTYCSTGFYLSSGSCVSWPTGASSVANCLYYAGASVCAGCMPNFYLSANGLACTATTATSDFCMILTAGSLQKCQFCRPDFYLFHGICIRVEDPLEGCLIYGESTTVCLVCKTEFYMSAGACLKYDD